MTLWKLWPFLCAHASNADRLGCENCRETYRRARELRRARPPWRR